VDLLLKNLETFDSIPQILEEDIFEKAFSVAELAKMTPEQYEQYQESLLTYIEVKEVVKTAEEEGRKKEKILVAQKMKQMGLSLEQISDITGLTEKEIKHIMG
jgi:predicted transposase/invertase (TIGR01784 family)